MSGKEFLNHGYPSKGTYAQLTAYPVGDDDDCRAPMLVAQPLQQAAGG